MKVHVHPGDARGVGYCRMIWPAEAAATAGVDVEVADSVPILRDAAGRVVGLDHPTSDVVVFQRPSHPDVVDLIHRFQARGIAVVVDVDDDVAAIDPLNRAAGWENPRNILKGCAMADLVTVSTPALADIYGGHGRVAILENCVPTALLDMPRDSDGRTVGWGGWTGSHPGDLAVTHGGVADAARRAGARFHVVGPPDDVQEQLGLDERPSSTGPLTKVAEYEYERALGALDVGIVPLRDTRFNAGKSWLKGVQYAARGIPFVASDVAEYRRLSAAGIGMLAPDRGRSWRARVLELLTDPERRQDAADRGRDLIREHHTYEGNAWRWAEAWATALEHRQAAGRQRVAA